jgi:putative hemolysin
MPQGPVALYSSLLIVSLVFSALFSASEAILLSVQRARVQFLVRSNVPGAELVARLVENPKRFLPTILLANNLSNTAAAALGTAIAAELLNSPGVAVLAATGVVTLLLLVFGEAIPKALGVRHAESASFIVARPIVFLGRALLPFVWGLNWIIDIVLRPFGGPRGMDLVTEEEVKAMISVGRESGAVASLEARLIERIMRFADHQVREVMTALRVDLGGEGDGVGAVPLTLRSPSKKSLPGIC